MDTNQLKKISPDAFNAWKSLCEDHAENKRAARERVKNSHFTQDDKGVLHGDGAQEYTRYTWDATTLTWVDDDADSE